MARDGSDRHCDVTIARRAHPTYEQDVIEYSRVFTGWAWHAPFTASGSGLTFTTNGNGTDHGWPTKVWARHGWVSRRKQRPWWRQLQRLAPR